MATTRSATRVTQLLRLATEGDERALERLMPLVYAELHRMARRQLRNERHQSLQPTALVNELYLRLVDVRQVDWQDRAHFFAMSARLMRRVLVDAARRRNFQKRGGGLPPVEFDEARFGVMARGTDLLAVDEALERLEALDARKARVVEMKIFVGLSVAEIATALGVSEDTVTRDWNFSRTWLARELDTTRRK
ncbi:MAG TPA: ECF-type sigma factor [Vicinamibacterales bacterium]|nr:ECF-type sigma factor [Vicinamibacterales bacterium]